MCIRDRCSGSAIVTPDAIACDYVIAADGAGSSVRAAAGMGLTGRRELGHLVNIHFRCRGLGHLLRAKGQRPGMLYFVYNEVREGCRWCASVGPMHRSSRYCTRRDSLGEGRSSLMKLWASDQTIRMVSGKEGAQGLRFFWGGWLPLTALSPRLLRRRGICKRRTACSPVHRLSLIHI